MPKPSTTPALTPGTGPGSSVTLLPSTGQGRHGWRGGHHSVHTILCWTNIRLHQVTDKWFPDRTPLVSSHPFLSRRSSVCTGSGPSACHVISSHVALLVSYGRRDRARIGPKFSLLFFFFKKKYLFIFRERGRKGERERNISRLPLAHP